MKRTFNIEYDSDTKQITFEGEKVGNVEGSHIALKILFINKPMPKGPSIESTRGLLSFTEDYEARIYVGEPKGEHN